MQPQNQQQPLLQRMNPAWNQQVPNQMSGQPANQSVGQKAMAPAANLAKPSNTLPPDKAAASPVSGQNNTANANYGLIGNPSLFQRGTSAQLNYGINGSPLIQKDNADITDWKNRYNDSESRLNQAGFTGNITGIEANRKNFYENRLGNLQQQLNNDIAIQGQQLGALSTASSQTSPVSVSPGNFYVNPSTGQDVSGGSINPFTGGMRQAQVGLGQSFTQQGQGIASGRSSSTQLKGLLQSSGLNQNDLALSNWVGNVVASNLSNPRLAPIQNALNTAISQYANALGVPPQTLMNQLTSQSSGQSIISLLDNLDQQAYGNYNATRQIGSGGIVSPSTPTPQQPTQGASAYTLPNGQTVHLQGDGTYK